MRRLFIPFLFLLAVPAFGQNADIRLLRQINEVRSERLTPAFLFITNSVTPIAIAEPLGLLSYGLIVHDKTSLQNGYTAGASLLLAGIISTGLKLAVDRDRPFVTYPDIVKRTKAGSPSFPSGHTTLAFAAAASLSLAYRKWYVIAPSFAWASAVGYSRMYLGVHYPSDVLVGALIGSGSAFLCYKVGKKLR